MPPVQYLQQRIIPDKDLLATPDHLMVLVGGVRAGPIPADKAVRPRRTEHTLLVGHLLPLLDRVGPRNDDVLARRGQEANRLLSRAAPLDRHRFAIDASVNDHRVTGFHLVRSIRNRADLDVRRQTGERFRSNMPCRATRQGCRRSSSGPHRRHSPHRNRRNGDVFPKDHLPVPYAFNEAASCLLPHV